MFFEIIFILINNKNLGGGARIVQTHGSGQPIIDVLNTTRVQTEEMGNFDQLTASAPFTPTNGVFCQETITREVDIRTSDRSQTRQPMALSNGDIAAQNTSQVSENLHSILKNADSWRQYSSTEDKLVFFLKKRFKIYKKKVLFT